MKSQSKYWNIEYSQKGDIWKKEHSILPDIFKGKDVLEIGVGNGKTLLSILNQTPNKITAVDFSEKAIELCKSKFRDKKIEFHTTDIFSFLNKKSFDIIIAFYIFNNLSSIERKNLADKILNSLSEKGILLFEDFKTGDFREISNKENKSKNEKHTIIKKNGIICHFFSKREVLSLFNKFSKVDITDITNSPIKNKPLLKRHILRITAKK